MDRTNFSSPESFLGWDEAGTGWKNFHKSCFGWKWALILQWAQKVSFTTSSSWSLPRIRGPVFYCSTLSVFSYTINYNVFFPGHQSAFIKKENCTIPILVRETEAQKDKTLLSPCRLDLETRSMQTIENHCCLIQGKIWSLNQASTRDAKRSSGFDFGACVVSSAVNLSCWLGKPHTREMSGLQCPITHTMSHVCSSRRRQW